MQGFFLYCGASGAVFQKFRQAAEGLAMVAGNRLGVEQAAENAFLHALCHRPEQRVDCIIVEQGHGQQGFLRVMRHPVGGGEGDDDLAAAVAAGGGIAVLLTMFPYASTRITTWRDPFASTSDEGYQIVQSLYSIGSGGLTGLGLGQSRQKYLYLPEEHNDFIFSVVCEELGFIGALLILTLFALLIIRGYWIALHSTDRYGFLVAAGITTLLAIQVILNVAVVTNLVPCTGISLPFFSYGGTALLMQMAEMGIVLSISRDLPAGRVGG